MRNIATVRSYFSPLKPGASAYTINGAASTPTSVTINNTRLKIPDHPVEKFTDLFLAVARFVLGEHWYERLRESTLTKDASQEIGNAECHVKGIGGNSGTGADQAGEYNVTHQTADARQERHAARDEGGIDEST